MKKRVHLHQLRIGMYVEEVEGRGRDWRECPGAFLIRTSEQIERILHCNAMSAVINVDKGRDVEGKSISEFSQAQIDHEAELLRDFSLEEIQQAKSTIANTAPKVRELLLSAHGHGTISMASATETVGEIMRSTLGQSGALIGLTKLKSRDEGTFIHCLAVSALMITFGRSLGFGEDTVELLGVGGLVHDIGKMTIPISILQKASKLDEKEFQVIRSHPDRGYHLLAQIKNTSPLILEVCKHHHEKYDGSGYPNGLRADEIPFSARIAAICDVYDALTTIRSYKKAWIQAQAVDLMLNARGHFDPKLLREFVARLVIDGKI
ncbi:HD family phosphohydrolase [Metarhizobium album]|uniref:HD family phosphohydrolase n=1 Tax=Metarhizobium album TaxID=2182425 RepID=A0A2U2DFI7_9HYPH|nr:HD-GYP domain-containing protein [Rhizobium album]PWE52083.1 HD family phosphohydrolase [Rhizobium album]